MSNAIVLLAALGRSSSLLSQLLFCNVFDLSYRDHLQLVKHLDRALIDLQVLMRRDTSSSAGVIIMVMVMGIGRLLAANMDTVRMMCEACRG